MTAVSVYSRTQSVTYLAENILRSFKEILRSSGLDPTKFVNEQWAVNKRGLAAWMATEELEYVWLEIIDPKTNTLVHKWEIQIRYEWSNGDGSFWADTTQLQYHLKKAGLAPSDATYRLVVQNKPNYTPVDGWSSTSSYSTAGMVRQSLGSTIEHNGLGGSAAYWRRAG